MEMKEIHIFCYLWPYGERSEVPITTGPAKVATLNQRHTHPQGSCLHHPINRPPREAENLAPVLECIPPPFRMKIQHPPKTPGRPDKPASQTNVPGDRFFFNGGFNPLGGGGSGPMLEPG